MNNNYENKILDAIQTLVDSAVSKAGYDKTIKAVVSKCVDPSKGKYIVRYQDSTFYAYSNDLDTVYRGGTSVYVLVPGNDMAQTKTILGSVDKLGSEYISLSESNAAYQEVGTSIATPKDNMGSMGVSSYCPNDSLILYDREQSPALNYLNIDTEGAPLYFQQSQYMEIGGTFTTRLNDEQKRKGNYGLVFDIDFLDGAVDYDPEDIEDHIINQVYVIDINSMTGNPYSYNYGSEQSAIFQIDGANFYRLNSITLQSKNFPKTGEAPYTDDIFVSDVILKGLVPLTREEITNNSLTFITPQGTYFSASEQGNPSLTIETEVKVGQNVIPNTGGLLRYYWFKEDSSIGITSPDYLIYGGPGWKCINQYNVIDSENNVREYVVDQDTLITSKSDNDAKENEYKCVVIYNDEVQIERNIIIYNQAAQYTVTIESDQGNYFKFGEGKRPTLTCNVETNITPAPTYDYTWTVTDSNNRTKILSETTSENEEYETAVADRDALLVKKTSGEITAAEKAELAELEETILNFDNNVFRVKGNKIYNIQLNEIVNFSKYTCSVSVNDEFKGKSNLTIKNSWEKDDNSYSLVIENTDQIFKYNINGIAPTSKSLEKPIVIKPLQFTLFNEMGQQVDDNKIVATDVFWYVPKENTMITASVPEDNIPTEEDGYLVYTGIKTLDFTIAPIYSNQRMNNTIKLVVKYNDRVLTNISELEFIKDGEIGSNGTDYICRIVPNVLEGAQASDYPIYTYNTTAHTGAMNYQLAANNTFFKVQLYKDGVNIFDGVVSDDSDENKPVTVVWSMLTNKYTDSVSDATNFSVNEDTGVFSYIDCGAAQDRAANIAKVTVLYEGATYYATMPIVLVQVADNNHRMELVNNSGFKYVMYTTDGLSPAYDSSNPFAVRVYETRSATEYDITMSLEDTDYTWSPLGSTYVAPSWVPENNLLERNLILEKNEKSYRPIEKFGGLSVNNGLKCVVTKENSIIATMYLPIHFYLNRFGNAALNGWDGNHIEINNNGGFILAPQVGAGKKESDNSYTGVFMGTVKEAGSSEDEIGLFGYNHGERTLALDAETGSARFGQAGKGQIVIDPTADSAKLYSDGYNIDYKTPAQLGITKYLYGYTYFAKDSDNNYYWLKEDVDYTVGSDVPTTSWTWNGKTVTTYIWDTRSTASGTGLEIDLNDPHIRFGNGNFHVERDGSVYAKGFATISDLESGSINIPGIENFRIEFATDTAQFETNANKYPTDNISRVLTCYAYYKDSATSGYTATLVDSTGTAITNPSIINGVQGTVAKSSSSQATTLTLAVASTRQVTSANTVFYIKFEHTESHDTVTKAFNANLIILGADGAPGAQGPQGPAGQNGKDGTSVTIIDSYPDEASLLAAFSPGDPSTAPNIGDGYIVDKDLYIYTGGPGYGSQSTDWTDAGQIKGEDGKDAKRCFIVASTEVFKSTDGGQSYAPTSSIITPYLQAVTFSKWQYNKNDGQGYRDLVGQGGTLPSGITLSGNVITVANTSEVFSASDTVMFQCLTNDNTIYDILTLTKVKDGVDGADGQDGRDGNDGQDGTNGINTATIYLYGRFANAPTVKPYGDTSTGTATTYTFASHSLSPTPTQTGWNTTMPSTGTDPLYVSIAVVASDQTTCTINPNDWSTPERMAQDGANGQTGPTGRGIISSSIEYKVDIQGTEPPQSGWSSTFPSSIDDGKFLWEKTTLNYSDNTSDVSYNVSRKGIDGDDGNSITIESQAIEYVEGDDGTTIPDDEANWSTTIPSVADGKYLWTRTTVNYSDETSTVSYTVSYQSVDGTDGNDAYTAILDNDSHSFPAGSETSTDVKAIVYKGTNQITDYTFDQPTVPEAWANKLTITRRDSNKTLRVTASNTLDIDHGEFTATIHADNKTFTKQFSWTLTTSKFTWVKYAPTNNTALSDMTDQPNANTQYMGVAVTVSSTAPSQKSSYNWSKCRGEDGTDGFSIWTTDNTPTSAGGGVYYINTSVLHGPSGVSPKAGEIVLEKNRYQYLIDDIEEQSGALVAELHNKTDLKGEDGTSPTAYNLIVTPAAVVKKPDGSYEPSAIRLTAKSQTGSGPISNYVNGKYEIYLNDSSEPVELPAGTESPPNFPYTVPNNTTSILVKLYDGEPTTSGVVVVDEQKVTVVTDGDDGVSATNLVCGKESATIQCNSSKYTTSASTIQIPYAGYIGDDRTDASVVVSDLPTGITYDNTSTTATTSADGLLKLNVANNSNLGNVDSGTITMTFTCNSKTFVKKLAWAKVIPGAAGADAYTVILSNESHTFVGNSTHALQADIDVIPIVYKGATQVTNFTLPDTISTGTDGLTATPHNDTSPKKVTVSASTSLTTTSGSFTIPISYDGKTFNKQFSWSLAKAGVNGTSPTTYNLIVSNTTVTKKTNNTYDPGSISFYVTSQVGNGAINVYTAGSYRITKDGTVGNWTGLSSSVAYSFTNNAPTTGILIEIAKESANADTHTIVDKQTVSVVKDGTNGSSATIYEIGTSSSQVVKKVDNSFAPDTITFTSTYRTGSTSTKTAYNCRWIIRVSDNGTSWHTIYKSNSDPSSSNTYSLTVTTIYTDVDTQQQFTIDPKFFMAYLCPRGSGATIANALASITVPVLNDSTDVEIGGRNYFLFSDVFSQAGTGTENRVTTEITSDGDWKIVVSAGSGAYHTWTHSNIIKENFETNTPFVISFDLKKTSGSETAPPKICFKQSSQTSADYKTMIGTVGSQWTRVYYVGKWDNSWEPSGSSEIQFKFDWTGLVGTYYIRRLKFEQGNVLTDWTAAEEDDDVTIEELSARSVTFLYRTTRTGDEPARPIVGGDNSDWHTTMPNPSFDYVWQCMYYEFADTSKNYYSSPSCTYTPAKITSNTQYCLCNTNEYSDAAVKGAWQDQPYAWKDEYEKNATENADTVRYQFIRSKSVDENQPEKIVNDQQQEVPNDKKYSYSTPVLDTAWRMFGESAASNNRYVAMFNKQLGNEQDSYVHYDSTGFYVEDKANKYGIKIDKTGIIFVRPIDPTDLSKGVKEDKVWKINGELDASQITVKNINAENILSGTLTLNVQENNNAAFILKGSRDEPISSIDNKGITVNNNTGDKIEIGSGDNEGIKATNRDGDVYFQSDPKNRNTVMTNTTITENAQLGNYVKIIQTSSGIALVSTYTGSGN